MAKTSLKTKSVLAPVPTTTPAVVTPKTPAVVTPKTPAVVTPKAKGGTMTAVRLAKAKFSDDMVITIVPAHLAHCPKQDGSAAAKRFMLYRQGMTVAQHRDAYTKAGHKAGLSRDDLRWDSAKGFVTVALPAAK